MSNQITYDDKVDLNIASDVANINKVTAADMNEIKQVVNAIDTETSTDITSILQAINNPTYTTTEGTDLSIDNTRVGKMKFEYYGDTEQQTYTGVNKIGTLTDFVANDTSAINVTYNTEANTITVKHLTTAAWKGIYKTLTGLTAGATMTISVYATTTTSTGWSLSVRNSGGTVINEITHNTSGTETHFTFTVPNDGSITIRAYAGYGDVAVNDTATYSKFQLEYGSSVSAYEPYVGGMPSPNPSYPQEVKTVTGENEIQICGKNLFDYSKVRVRSIYSFATTNFLSGGADNTSVSINNQNVLSGTASPYVAVAIPFKFEANKTIYNNAYTGERSLLIYDKNGDVVAHISPPTTSYTPNQTFDGYLGVGIKSGVNVTGEKIMFSYENNADFEPYQSQNYEINLGTKNLFDKNNINLLDGYYVDGTGKVTAGSNNKFNWVKLSPNTTYTLNQTIVSNVTRRVALYSSQPAANSIGTIIGTFTGTNTIDLTFNTNANSYIGWVYCNTSNLNGHTQQEMIDSIILVKGTTLDFITDTPIELCKIGNYQDYIYNNGGKWFKHKEVGKIILNGAETWVYDNDYKYFRCPSYNFTSLNAPLEMTTALKPTYNQYCNLFTINKDWSGAGSFRDSTTTQGLFYPVQNAGYKVLFRNLDYTNTTDFANWMASNNIIVYYPLATPIEEEITELTLINQLNAIKYGAESYYGTTNITITSADLQLILKAQTLEKIGD